MPAKRGFSGFSAGLALALATNSAGERILLEAPPVRGRLLFLMQLMMFASPGCSAPEEARALERDAATGNDSRDGAGVSSDAELSVHDSGEHLPDSAFWDASTPTKCTSRTVSFANDVAPLLGVSCAGTECHPTSSADYAYSFYVNVPADECFDGRMRILPGHPEKSYVIDKLTGQNLCTGLPMPIERPFNEAQIQVVYDWICGGALNN